MSQTPPLLGHLAIIGLGLIGSSIARAVRDYGVARQVTVTDASAQVRTIARDLNLGKVVETSADAVRDADMVILCIPVAQCGSVMAEIERHLKPGAIVSDVGSVKGAVVRDMIPHMPANVHFVPAHPVAGTEQSGPEAGFAELFADRWCILTPPDGTNDSAVKTTTAFWQALGADVEIMPIDHHDQVLAITSHLPHLIAFTIVGTASHAEKASDTEIIKFSAGGFRDFTRIAASDPTMWRDIFLNNKAAVLEMLTRFNNDLAALTKAIRDEDGETLFKTFASSRKTRLEIIKMGQDSAAPDFGREHHRKKPGAIPLPYSSSLDPD